MRRHLLTLTLVRDYRAYQSTTHQSSEQARQKLEALPLPDCWSRDWILLSAGPGIISEEQSGVSCHREVTWTITYPIWTSNEKKAREIAEREVKSLEVSCQSGPDRTCPNWQGCETSVTIEDLSLELRDEHKLKHDITLTWRDLASIDAGAWPGGNPIDQGFEAFRHLIADSDNYQKQHQWHTSHIGDLLSRGIGEECQPFHYNSKIRAISSIEDLQTRFQSMLLGTAQPFYDDWRRDKDVAHDRTLSFRQHHRGNSWNDLEAEGGIKQPFNMLQEVLVGARNMTLRRQLNSVHAKAVNIRTIDVKVRPTGFSFIVHYGFEGSSWDEVITETRGDEPFIDTLQRAWMLMHRDLLPDYALQHKQAADARWEKRQQPYT